jgi:hypothetical protein
MATAAFTTLLPKVLPNVPGCPQPLALQHIRDAAIRVCERTLAWRYVQPSFALSPGVHEYPYNKPQGSVVHVVFAAHVNGSPLEILTLEQAITKYPEWADLYGGVDPLTLWGGSGGFNGGEFNSGEFNAGSGFTMSAEAMESASEPRSLTQLTPDKYVVLPLPDDERAYTLRMFYALRPASTAEGMDGVVLDELSEAIVHSALQQLLVMPGVAWSDRELAAYHAKQALRDTTERRARANLGNARGVLRATAPRFA